MAFLLRVKRYHGVTGKEAAVVAAAVLLEVQARSVRWFHVVVVMAQRCSREME